MATIHESHFNPTNGIILEPVPKIRFYNYCQTNVLTAPAARLVRAARSLYIIEKDFGASLSFTTMNTFVHAGVRKDTLYKLSVMVDAILMEPGGTNLEACAII